LLLPSLSKAQRCISITASAAFVRPALANAIIACMSLKA
jgi:hypothetical protein